MKITKSQLKQIILEETKKVLEEVNFLARSSKAMPVRSIGPRVDSDGDGSLSPDELRGVADSLEQDELASYTCFQLEEVMRQKQEAGSSREEMMELKQLMRKKGCFGA
mgnify:CR=1 FL=1|jgi:hypothetical protein|tara:strand:+ start:3788 stop:4111 length:324 start_codon:yes stop_codon:yes gene_type:complete